MARVSDADGEGGNAGEIDEGENPDGPRDRLVAAAIRLLEDSGPEALQARKLAAEIGASTMAVYTYFGGIKPLIHAMAREGFARLSRRLEEVPATDDPVADLFGLGLAYRDHALDSPQLYRVMFGVTAPGGHRMTGKDLTTQVSPTDMPEGAAAFGHLVNGVARIRPAGDEEPARVAAQLWSAIHGFVLLETAGYFGPDGQGLTQVWLPLGVKLATGPGRPAGRMLRSAQKALARRNG